MKILVHVSALERRDYYFMHLDPEQTEAVQATEGPMCIVAGPGSGKTFTIVERIFYLIRERGVDPARILAITFTVKASLEMRERLAKRLGSEVKLPYVRTFHALAFEIMSHFAERIGYELPLKIVSESEQHEIMREVDGEEAYKQALAVRGLVDFDDILVGALKLVKNFLDVREEYQSRFRYILVDEYQDTSPIQAEFIDLLAGKHKNICIIGDPDQSIYGFRGADMTQFSSFKERYPAAKKIFLHRNYRSHPCLVSVFQEFLKPSQFGTVREGNQDARISLTSLDSPKHEAQFIARTVRQLIGGVDLLDAKDTPEQYHAGDVAVLYRVHGVGQFLEKTFAQLGIPYIRVGAKNFFEYVEIRDILERVRRRVLTQALSVEMQNLVGEISGDNPKTDRLRELIHRAMLYDHLPPEEAKQAFLQEAALSTSEELHSRAPHTVTLMSAHAAKGLEFPVVFVAGLQDGLFPYIREGETCNFEEEKRLLYVAMTRAKEKLYLTHAKIGGLYGGNSPAQPCRFLKDLPETQINREEITPKKKKPNLQQKLF